MSDNELLPCPFCGGSVTLERIESRAGEWHGIICRNTANRGGSCAYECHPSRTPEAATARWNMRTPTQYTAVDMATAAADGFRDGAASVVVDLEPDDLINEAGDYLYIEFVRARIIAAGGSVKE